MSRIGVAIQIIKVPGERLREVEERHDSWMGGNVP